MAAAQAARALLRRGELTAITTLTPPTGTRPRRQRHRLLDLVVEVQDPFPVAAAAHRADKRGHGSAGGIPDRFEGRCGTQHLVLDAESIGHRAAW